jgi:hypothetical protein
MKAKTSKSAKITKGKRGRPRVSNLSDNEQARLRMKRVREQRRRGNLVPVEVWIPKSQHDSLLKQGYDLSAAATKAFALLLKRQKPAASTEEVREPMHFDIDLNDVQADYWPLSP